MKKTIAYLLGLLCLFSIAAAQQPQYLRQAWQDPGFVERFTHSFLPLAEQEPKVSESEAELFSELAELLDNNQNEQALQRLREAMRTTPAEEGVSAALNYTAANLLLQQGRFEEAIREYEIAIRKFDTFRRAYKNLGLARIQAGLFEEAIDALVRAVELGDAAGDTFGLLGYSYLNTGNPVAALEGYRQASLLNPGNQEWKIGKAEALMRTERYEEAIAEFKQLIREMPGRDAFYTSIANAYLSLNETDNAARFLEILRRREAAQPSALALLGDIYINDGLPKLGADAYQDALATGNLSTDRIIRSVQVLLQRGATPAAEDLLASLKEARSDNFSEATSRKILNLEAQLALADGRNDEAAEILEKVLEKDPLNGNALILLGEYHRAAGDLESSVYFFERALGLTDFQREAQLQLAQIFVRQREYRKAIRQLEAAQQLQYSANVQDFLDAVRAAYNRSL
jgi:tetratricopeptide (TPR) repeat protein